MNDVAIALLALTVASAAWAVVACLGMASWLSRHVAAMSVLPSDGR